MIMKAETMKQLKNIVDMYDKNEYSFGMRYNHIIIIIEALAALNHHKNYSYKDAKMLIDYTHNFIVGKTTIGTIYSFITNF